MKTFLARAMACVALVTLLLPISAAAAFNKMYVFGDSLSDSGVAYSITGGVPVGFPISPPNNQRNSNDRVAVEYLADNLGLALQPASVPGGTNYAVSGAMSGPRTLITDPPIDPPYTSENFASFIYGGLFGTNLLQSGTSLLSQVSQFMSPSPPSFDPSSTLFVVWAGANDFFFDPSEETLNSAVDNIGNAIFALAGSGARSFLLPGLPDLSLTPGIMEAEAADPGTGIAAGYQALSLGFNDALENILIPSLEAAGLDLDITYFDVNAALLGVLADPGAYGITNTTEGCLVFDPTKLDPLVSLCSNPDEYLFWDSVHPTDRIHNILGNQFAAAVPEPETLATVALGLFILAAFRRRKTLAGSHQG